MTESTTETLAAAARGVATGSHHRAISAPKTPPVSLTPGCYQTSPTSAVEANRVARYTHSRHGGSLEAHPGAGRNTI